MANLRDGDTVRIDDIEANAFGTAANIMPDITTTMSQISFFKVPSEPNTKCKEFS